MSNRRKLSDPVCQIGLTKQSIEPVCQNGAIQINTLRCTPVTTIFDSDLQCTKTGFVAVHNIAQQPSSVVSATVLSGVPQWRRCLKLIMR